MKINESNKFTGDLIRYDHCISEYAEAYCRLEHQAMSMNRPEIVVESLIRVQTVILTEIEVMTKLLKERGY